MSRSRLVFVALPWTLFMLSRLLHADAYIYVGSWSPKPYEFSPTSVPYLSDTIPDNTCSYTTTLDDKCKSENGCTFYATGKAYGGKMKFCNSRRMFSRHVEQRVMHSLRYTGEPNDARANGVSYYFPPGNDLALLLWFERGDKPGTWVPYPRFCTFFDGFIGDHQFDFYDTEVKKTFDVLWTDVQKHGCSSKNRRAFTFDEGEEPAYLMRTNGDDDFMPRCNPSDRLLRISPTSAVYRACDNNNTCRLTYCSIDRPYSFLDDRPVTKNGLPVYVTKYKNVSVPEELGFIEGHLMSIVKFVAKYGLRFLSMALEQVGELIKMIFEAILVVLDDGGFFNLLITLISKVLKLLGETLLVALKSATHIALESAKTTLIFLVCLFCAAAVIMKFVFGGKVVFAFMGIFVPKRGTQRYRRIY